MTREKIHPPSSMDSVCVWMDSQIQDPMHQCLAGNQGRIQYPGQGAQTLANAVLRVQAGPGLSMSYSQIFQFSEQLSG